MSKIHVCYRIVEVDDKGNYKTLFHGINGSRVIVKNKWLRAEKKLVSDGNRCRKYVSGFHVLKSYDDCLVYRARFKKPRNLKIVQVEAKSLKPKKHSPYPVFLANEMRLNGS